MRYIDDFRRTDLAARLQTAIHREARTGRDYRIMEFCGGHTHAIFRHGIQDLIPGNVSFIHGPGCPVCVLPVARLDMAVAVAREPNVTLLSYGDMMRVPASRRTSLLKARAAGADIRMIYSTQDALRIARDNPAREIVLFAIGFETTTPPTAVAIHQAAEQGIGNFSVFCNHVLTPAAIQSILEPTELDDSVPVRIDGFLGPSHVSTVIGSRPYEGFAKKFHKPVVIAGFEPLDVLQSTLMVIRQLNEGRAEVENQYRRAVTPEGNLKAQALVRAIFTVRQRFDWRGLGTVPDSALAIHDTYAAFDAEKRFAMVEIPAREAKSCECPQILRGVKKPTDCRLFGTVCTPENPIGSCMVSAEGACAAYWSYRRFRPAA